MNFNSIIIKYFNMYKAVTNPKEFHVAPREFNSLSIRLSGKIILYDKDIKYLSDAHTLTFIPSGKPYKHQILTPSEQIAVHFRTIDRIGENIEVFTLPLHYNMEDLFYTLYQHWEIKQKSDLQCMSIFYNILSLIAKNFSINDNPKKNILNNSVAYMHTHYRENSFNVSMLYKLAYVSPAYYRRIFNEINQCSPVEYLKKLRINYAKQLLYNGYHTISEIAELSGFSTLAYFSYEFKKITGYSPSQYRHNKKF